MKTRNKLGPISLAAFALIALGGSHNDDYGCGGPPILHNNGFDIWCGETLCYWQVDKGQIAPAPTWHSEDKAVELVGDAVAISQLSDVDWLDVGCIEFSLLANVEPTATVHIEMDIYDDGVVDWRQPIPAATWAPFKYLVKLPVRYSGIRFRVTKSGSGRAQLAQLVVEKSGECNMPPIVIEEQPSGAACLEHLECEAGACAQGQFPAEYDTCGECATDADCEPGQVCGSATPAQPVLAMYRACGAPARHQLGERCVSDSECSTGVCCGMVCSTCCLGLGCEEGETCGRRQVEGELEWWFSPHQCNPAAGGAATGESCLIDADCASGSCAGSGDMKVCLFDGRACTAASDCPSELACVTIGTAGGTCD